MQQDMGPGLALKYKCQFGFFYLFAMKVAKENPRSCPLVEALCEGKDNVIINTVSLNELLLTVHVLT